jgi:aminopeptidase N
LFFFFGFRSTDFIETEFAESVIMSSYLPALVVSDYKCLHKMSNSKLNTTVGSCARSTAYDQLEYSLEEAIKILEYLEELYQVDFDLPKLG